MASYTVQQFNQLIDNEIEWAANSGVVLEQLDEGKAVMRLPYQKSSIRPGGSISGPHIMLLNDICMYAIVLSLVGEVKLAVTTNFNINFLRKPRESDLIAEGKIIKLGKRLAIMEVSTFSAEDLVAHSTGTYSIPPQ